MIFRSAANAGAAMSSAMTMVRVDPYIQPPFRVRRLTVHGIGDAATAVPAAHFTPPASEYVARSTTSASGVGPALSTVTAKRFPAASGNIVPIGIVSRAAAAMGRLRASVEPSSNASVTCTEPATADVFATSTYVCASAAPPCAPSAIAHRAAVTELAAARCESDQTLVPIAAASSGPGHHIARSTTMPTPLVDTIVV